MTDHSTRWSLCGGAVRRAEQALPYAVIIQNNDNWNEWLCHREAGADWCREIFGDDAWNSGAFETSEWTWYVAKKNEALFRFRTLAAATEFKLLFG